MTGPFCYQKTIHGILSTQAEVFNNQLIRLGQRYFYPNRDVPVDESIIALRQNKHEGL